MLVNETWAHYSTWTYTTAIVIYVLAMMFCLADQVLGKAKTGSIRAEARVPELVTAGGATSGQEHQPADPVGAESAPDERPLSERLGRMGISLIILGLLFHLAAIVLRGMATTRVPWGNIYEYISLASFAGIAIWVAMVRKFPIRRATGFVLLPIVILMALGGTVLYSQAAPVEPALQSYWLVIHVSAVAISTGILLVSGVSSMLYLVRATYENNSARFAKLAAKLPTATVFDQLAYRTAIVGLPLFTFAVICGAIWAESAWGKFWSWDPVEVVSFIAWLVYAAYLHARATAGWRGNKAAIINLIGFVAIMFNLFFINLFQPGMHSYAGVG